ncbi:MAG: AarF/UbiB family protein [Polyangiaceae bacterium]
MTALLRRSEPLSLPPRPSMRPGFRAPGLNNFRFVRAYVTTFQVIASYLWLSFRSRIFGADYREQRIAEVHRTNAIRVEQTIIKLQGLFIKVGQLLSILANFLPDEFRAGLERLQDQIPPRPFPEIRRRLEEEFKKPVLQVFASFDEVPIASASLGQVHEARLHDGTRVAVKVQHHDIDRILHLDLRVIRRIMSIVQWFVPFQGMDAFYHQIKELLHRELDFALEADNIEIIAKNFANDDAVRFPVPVRSVCTKRVLTATFVEGCKVGDLASLDAMGVDRKELATRLVRIFCQMIFKDGIYHADPHPGNLLVDAKGNLVLLDFGAVASLSPSMREGIPEFLEGVLRRDTDRILKALRKMGFISRTSDVAMTEKIVDYFHRRFQEEVRIESFNLKDVKIDPQRGFENLLDLRKMNVGMKELSSVFHVPRDWVLLERTLVLLYGSCSALDPDLNPMGIIRPYLTEFVLGNRDFSQIAIETVREMAMEAITLPEDLKKYLTRAVRGELEVKVSGLKEGSRAVYSTGRQLMYAAFFIAGGLAALQLHLHGDDKLARYPAIFAVAAFILWVLASIFGRPRLR